MADERPHPNVRPPEEGTQGTHSNQERDSVGSHPPSENYNPIMRETNPVIPSILPPSSNTNHSSVLRRDADLRPQRHSTGVSIATASFFNSTWREGEQYEKAKESTAAPLAQNDPRQETDRNEPSMYISLRYGKYAVEDKNCMIIIWQEKYIKKPNMVYR